MCSPAWYRRRDVTRPLSRGDGLGFCVKPFDLVWVLLLAIVAGAPAATHGRVQRIGDVRRVHAVLDQRLQDGFSFFLAQLVG